MKSVLATLALMTLAAGAHAQSAVYSDAAGMPGAPLADAYHLRLASAWPQTSDADEACRNGGDEVVEGTLRRGVDGVYRGSLARRSRILFCGVHGTSGTACELVLEGDGQVTMTGLAVPDATSPSGSALRLSWRPAPAHGAAAHGACSADFKRAVERMYRTVVHGVEFALPAAGEGRRVERLEDYAWTVEVGEP